MSQNKIILLDTETTGKVNSKAIEVAYLTLDDKLNIVDTFNKRYNPGIPIEYGAMAVHHIMDDDVSSCDPIESFVFPPYAEYMIGHNIDFDWEVLGKPNVKRICTLALSRYLLPELDSHNQTALMYYFIGKRATNKVKNAHSALCDIKNNLGLFYTLIDLSFHIKTIKVMPSIEEIYELSEKARIPTIMAFGKHKGMALKDLPKDYKQWLLTKADIDDYLRKALME